MPYYPPPASGTPGSSGVVVAEAPPAAVAGTLWWESDTGQLYLRYNDGTSQQWVAAVAGAGGVPGGADTQVQFNDAGMFGGDAGITYNKATDTLTLVGNVVTAAPTVNGHATTKLYVDTAVGGKVNVADFAEAVDDRVFSLLVAGANISFTYDDEPNDTLTINATGGGGIPDAPNDGLQYGRQSLGWTQIVGGPGGSGDVVGPASAVADRIAVFNGTTGKIIKDGGSTIANLAPVSHTHTAANITDFSEAVDDRVNGLLVAGTNVTLTYNDVANTMTVAATSGGSGDVVGPAGAVADRIAVFNSTTGKIIKDGGSTIANLAPVSHTHTAANVTDFSEAVDDRVNGLLVAGTNVTLTYDDVANTMTVASPGREQLTASRTYFVRTDGNDSNTGLVNSAAGAFLTIQKAIDVTAALDVSIYGVTIQVADGAYTQNLVLKDPVAAGGTVLLQGNITTPANVTIDVATGNCISCTGMRLYQIRGFSLDTAVASYCLSVTSHAFLTMGNMVFRGSSFAHIGVVNGATLVINNAYSIAADGAQYHWYTEGNGHITCQGRTITLTGTPAFGSYFASCLRASIITCNSCTFVNAATGARFNVSNGGLIESGGAGATYLPGSIAGTGTNYGAAPWGLYA